jgi:hypothetical protein
MAAKKSTKSVLQHKIADYIAKVPAELSIIYGTQFPGVKPDLSCALVVEGALRVYLKKFDPLQNTARWGLGKLFGRSQEKHNFPKRFNNTIEVVTKIRNGAVHLGDKNANITLDDLRKFTSEFLKWFFEKVALQEIPNDIFKIIFTTKEKATPKEKVESKRHSFKEREIKITGSGEDGSPKVVNLHSPRRKSKESHKEVPTEIKTPYKLHLHIEGGSNFKRDYYESVQLTLNDFRGSIPKSVSFDLGISFDFNSHDILFRNKSKNVNIEIGGKQINARMKPKFSLGTYKLIIGDYNFNFSISNY